MNWNSWSDFVAMGGYAGYVWGSLGVTFALMGVEVVLVGQRWRTIKAQLRRLHAVQGARVKGQS